MTAITLHQTANLCEVKCIHFIAVIIYFFLTAETFIFYFTNSIFFFFFFNSNGPKDVFDFSFFHIDILILSDVSNLLFGFVLQFNIQEC